MHISHTPEVDGGRMVYPIGRIEAATGWHASNANPADRHWKDIALDRLIAVARDLEADAVVQVNYRVDDVKQSDLTGVTLERVAASGLAVRFSRG